MLKLTTSVGVLLAFGVLNGGCATGTKFDYAKQNDSPAIRVPETEAAFGHDPYTLGDSNVDVDKIDGAHAGFPRKWFDPRKELYCAPGKHEISLTLSHGPSGIIGFPVVRGASGTVDVLLEKDHVYRFTAIAGAEYFSVTLWDETGGAESRRTSAEWSIEGQR
jgi:hypothetical protein